MTLQLTPAAPLPSLVLKLEFLPSRSKQSLPGLTASGDREMCVDKWEIMSAVFS